MADQKLNLNIYTWVKFSTWELIPYMTDYKLEFMTQKFWSGKVTEFLRQCYVVLFDTI